MATNSLVKLTVAQWREEAQRRYGPSLRKIRFRCPSCEFIQSGRDFLDLGMSPEDAVRRLGFSCIGRWVRGRDVCDVQEAFLGPPGPCNYAGGGLICISPILVTMEDGKEQHFFDFANEPLAATGDD